MSLKTEVMQEICDLATRQVNDLYGNLQLTFIHHAPGLFNEIVSLSEHEVRRHPAGATALSILEKNKTREQSGFLGIAIAHEVRWMGLASEDHVMALFNINTDEFETAKDARRAIYHLTWHAIDLMEVRQRPEYLAKFKSGPMIPKRSPLNMARLNLQADAFSSVMCGLQGEDNAIEMLAKQRARDSIHPNTARRAEDYPFAIAMEATQYGYDEIQKQKPAKTHYAEHARQLAIDIGKTFDDESIRQWWAFAEPAQDMAWLNFTPEDILSAAIYTSEDPFVRATGYLVSDITGVEPASMTSSAKTYNAFAKTEHNSSLHRELAEQAFEEAVTRGVKDQSGQPLITVANEQNEHLTEGVIMGWCALALQASARAFESALSKGVSPLQAARLEFEGNKESTDWETLEKISDAIIAQKRQGYGVSMSNVVDICDKETNMTPVLESLKTTMRDPVFVRKLELANDMGLKGPTLGPSGPAPAAPAQTMAPQTPAPVIPSYIPGPTGPGMGSGSGASHAARLRMMAERARQIAQGKIASSDEETAR